MLTKSNEILAMKKAKMIRHRLYRIFGKRFLDLVCSYIALLIMSPLFLIIMIIIKIDSKGPAIYKQKRLGQYTTGFTIYKFRTMVVDADRMGPKSTSIGDKRITRTGKILRELSLDELPQLINILKGDMSLIGPRPDIYKPYNKLSKDEILRVCLKPGITGLAQVNGRSSLTEQKRMKYDLEYIENCSLRLDIRILVKTITKVVKRENVNSHEKVLGK